MSQYSIRRLVTKYALAAPGANTDFGAFTPQYPVSQVRMSIAVTTSTILNLSVTDGTTGYILGLNGSVALAAGDLYTFTFPISKLSAGGDVVSASSKALSYAFQVETD